MVRLLPSAVCEAISESRVAAEIKFPSTVRSSLLFEPVVKFQMVLVLPGLATASFSSKSNVVVPLVPKRSLVPGPPLMVHVPPPIPA